MKKLILLLMVGSLIISCATTESKYIDRTGTYTHTSILLYETTECSGNPTEMINEYIETNNIVELPIAILNSDGSLEWIVDGTTSIGIWTQDDNNTSTLSLDNENLTITFIENGFYYIMIELDLCSKTIYTKVNP